MVFEPADEVAGANCPAVGRHVPLLQTISPDPSNCAGGGLWVGLRYGVDSRHQPDHGINLFAVFLNRELGRRL